MAKATNKTQPTAISPEAFLATIEHPLRRTDSLALLELFKKVTNLAPKM